MGWDLRTKGCVSSSLSLRGRRKSSWPIHKPSSLHGLQYPRCTKVFAKWSLRETGRERRRESTDGELLHETSLCAAEFHRKKINILTRFCSCYLTVLNKAMLHGDLSQVHREASIQRRIRCHMKPFRCSFPPKLLPLLGHIWLFM